MSQNNKSRASIVMGSQSDYKTMKLSTKILKSLKIKHEIKIVSAHRTPKRMYDFAKNAKKNKISVIIAGAGGSAHLPGMIASLTSLPVIEDEREHPAFISGNKTFLFGLINFAVSAIKCTPAITIMFAEVFEASTARANESAEKSAMP